MSALGHDPAGDGEKATDDSGERPEDDRQERARRHAGVAVAHAAQQHHQPRGVLRDRRAAAARGARAAHRGREDHRRGSQLGARRDRLRGALLRRLHGPVRPRLRTDRAQPRDAAVAVRAGGQLGRLGQRPGRARARRMGAARTRPLGGADRQAHGADLRADERRSRRSRGGDRDPDVARPAARLDQPAADAAARLHRGGGDRRHDRRAAAGRGAGRRIWGRAAAAPRSR